MTSTKSPVWLRVLATSCALLVVSLLVGGLFGGAGVVQSERLSDELFRVQAMNADLSLENRRLEEEVLLLKGDRPYIESVIREELGFVRQDEMIFLFERGRSGVGESLMKGLTQP